MDQETTDRPDVRSRLAPAPCPLDPHPALRAVPLPPQAGEGRGGPTSPLPPREAPCYRNAVWNWLRRLLCRDGTSPHADRPPPWAADLLDEVRQARLAEADGPPPWAADLADLLQKSARSQGKSALR